MKQLIEEIKKNEGFVGTVYQDTLGFDTIGYGTKMPITEDEAEAILVMRLKAKIKELEKREPFTNELPLTVQEILAEMCYQMGVSGVLRFKKMWAALQSGDYNRAAIEMLDSRWAVQTPNRAKKLAAAMSNVR